MGNRKLKVLFLPAWYPSKKSSVAGIFIKEHAKAASLYNEVVVLYSEGCNKNLRKTWQIISDKKEDGIRTIRIMHKKSPIPKTSYPLYLWSIHRAFKKLLKEAWEPDIIHAHIFEAGVVGVILCKIYNTPLIITEHWTGFPLHKLTLSQRIKARFAMNHAQTILPVSKNLKNSIRNYGIRNKFKVIPNVINNEIFHPLSSQVLNYEDNKKRILLVALLSPAKGISYLLESVTQLQQKRNDFVLDIVGDGPNRQEYEELSEKLGLQNLVKFHGLKSKHEIAKFMRRSNFFVLSSLWENLPCVLLEAMASGLPIIATTVGGIPEIINREIGILVPPKNVNALVKAINYMLDHYQDYSIEKIARYAKEKFSYESVGKTLHSIYRGITYKKPISNSHLFNEQHIKK